MFAPGIYRRCGSYGEKSPRCHHRYAVRRSCADSEIAEWCAIARVLHDLKSARIGHFGHVLEAMLDMHSDPTAITASFGCHIVQTEPEDILRLQRTVTENEIAEKKRQILDMFDTPDPKSDPITRKLTDDDLHVAARVSVALDKFVEEKDLDGLAYYYEGEEGSDMRKLVTNFIVGNSLLTAAGFPMCGESDLKTCLAMMIMDRLEMAAVSPNFTPSISTKGRCLWAMTGRTISILRTKNRC